MNLVLSRHGIWYSRFTYLLPSGKRKEIRRSLRTRCKRTANRLVQERLQLRPLAPEPCTENHSHSPKDRLKLKQSIELWMAERAKEGLSEREQSRIKTYLDLLLATLGDKPVHSINRKQANVFKDALTASDKSITTVNNYLKRARALFDWLSTRIDDLKNPFQGLLVKQQKAPAEQRPAHSKAELETLSIESQHLPMYKKWIIDIALSTGMRQNEICQLYKDDIQKIEGIWCFNVTDARPDQKLKNKASKRLIPISSTLLDKGLLEQASGSGRLFPELTGGGDRGYARYFQKWFSQWRKVRGIPDFHSLRHTVATKLKSEGIPEQFTAQLLGHAAGGMTYGRYGKTVDVRQLVPLVELL